MKNIISIIAISLAMAACGEKNIGSTASISPAGIEGKFANQNGMETFTFTKGGEVTYEHPKYPTKVAVYKKQDAEITFQLNGGHQMKMNIVDDTHLKSILGDTYVKQ